MVIKPKPTTIEIPIVAILVNKLTETMLAADLLPLEPDDELEEEEEEESYKEKKRNSKKMNYFGNVYTGNIQYVKLQIN